MGRRRSRTREPRDGRQRRDHGAQRQRDHDRHGRRARGCRRAIGAVGIVIDGGGSVITTGVKGFVEVPFACTITAATLLSTDARGDERVASSIDVWKDTYANYPPIVGDTITASAKPTLSRARPRARDTTLTGWTTAIAAGDVLGFTVDSAATVTKVLLELRVTLT